VSKFLFAAAAAALTVAAPAFAADRSFTQDGVTYTYSATTKGDQQILEGTADDGAKFRLAVKNGWVDGYVNDTRVSFRAPKVKSAVVAAR